MLKSEHELVIPEHPDIERNEEIKTNYLMLLHQ